MSIYSQRALGPAFITGLVLVCSVALTAQTPAGAREGLADLPGVRLWFTDSGGAGAAVVFVHAATGSSRVWEYQRPAFSARGYRVITYDRRGYGRSVADPSGAQPGTGADDLNALMDCTAAICLVARSGCGEIGPQSRIWGLPLTAETL